MIKHFLLVVLAFISLQVGFAQDNLFTLEEITTNYNLYPVSLRNFEWRDADEFTYIDGSNLVTAKVGEDTTVLMTLAELNAYFDEDQEQLKRFPSIKWTSQDEFYFQHDNAVWKYEVAGKYSTLELETYIMEEAENVEVASNYNTAFTIDHNLYVAHSDNYEVSQVTHDAEAGSEDLVYGEAAHRVEFGISKGIYWSPEGQKVAFYRMDQSMVTDYPLINYMADRAEVKYIKYPFAGDSSHHVTIGVFDALTRETVYLNTGGPYDQFLTNITWDPSGQKIYVAVVSRSQDTMWLKRFDAKTGNFEKTLFMETHSRYVEPEHGPVFIEDEKDEFLWLSERDGFNHLYHYDISGKLKKQLTRGEWEVTGILGFDDEGSKVFVTTTEGSPVEQHIYKIKLRNANRDRLTREAGVHHARLAPDGRYLLDVYSNLKTPRIYQVIDTKQEKIKATLLQGKNPVEDYALGEVELLTLKTGDDTKLHARLIKPVDFDPAKKYPVIVYVYGGPHLQLVSNSWMGGANLFFQYLAQQGYVVFSMDNRGSKSRGLRFEQEVFRELGSLEMEDQLKGVEYLKSLSYVDTSRMGVYGWSYGGFMTTALMMRHPGTFEVGVAGGPVTDWRYYEIMYGERYMDRPHENVAGYDTTSLMNYVGNLEGRLLIIHGMQDDVVVPQHSMRLMRKSVEEGVLIDFFPYVTHPHNVRGRDRAHLYKKIVRYFEDYL